MTKFDKIIGKSITHVTRWGGKHEILGIEVMETSGRYCLTIDWEEGYVFFAEDEMELLLKGETVDNFMVV